MTFTGRLATACCVSFLRSLVYITLALERLVSCCTPDLERESTRTKSPEGGGWAYVHSAQCRCSSHHLGESGELTVTLLRSCWRVWKWLPQRTHVPETWLEILNSVHSFKTQMLILTWILMMGMQGSTMAPLNINYPWLIFSWRPLLRRRCQQGKLIS